MPKFPNSSTTLDSVGGSVFSSLARRIVSYPGEAYPLQVGDTWAEPPVGCRMQDLGVAEHPGMHRYAPPRGLPALRAAVAGRFAKRTGLEVSTDQVLISAGATGGLSAVVGSITDPGDEILIATPYWPLIRGIVHCARAVPVDVPILGSDVETAEDAVAAFEKAWTEATVAVYVSTPNNPTGRVLPASWLTAVAEWCRARDLWLLSDEVYEDYVYEGEHTYSAPLAPERTFSVHSFSKAFGMAGNRCGYVVGPPEAMAGIAKVSTHSFYSTPTASQLAAIRTLAGAGDEWLAEMKPQYHALGRDAADALGMPHPEGSTFLFVDVSARLDERGVLGFLEGCADRGLFLAPGESFGPYPGHARICFTCARPEVVRRGIAVLAELLGR